MPEMSLAQLTEWKQEHERDHDKVVTEKVYNLQISQLTSAIGKMEEQMRWQNRLIVSNIVALVLALVVYLVTQGPS